jgi:hypothetical protein
LARRGGYLAWYTADTGKLGAAKPYSVHFGVNALGLINVYAKDISYLPETHKKLWVAHNCSPEGQVSRELLMSQMEVKPANTVAPEVSLWRSVDSLQTAFTNKFSRPLFRGTMGEPSARLRIHRFHAIDREGIFYLSKELTRGLIEWFDITSLKKLTPSQDNKLGSLKRLEKLVSATGAEGYRIMGPLFAVYDLRIADAHISSSDVSDKFQLLGLAPRADNYVEQGKMLLQKVADTLVTISACLRSNPNP